MKDQEQHLIEVYGKFIQLDRQCREVQNKLCHRDDLTDCQCRYLSLIEENEPLTSVEFARLISVSKPTVSQLISRFLQDGYVVKETCPHDKRACYIRVTEKGRQIVRADQTARFEVVRLIETNLEESEVNQLIELLDKLLENEEEI